MIETKLRVVLKDDFLGFKKEFIRVSWKDSSGELRKLTDITHCEDILGIECILANNDIRKEDVAKVLIDYGFFSRSEKTISIPEEKVPVFIPTDVQRLIDYVSSPLKVDILGYDHSNVLLKIPGLNSNYINISTSSRKRDDISDDIIEAISDAAEINMPITVVSNFLMTDTGSKHISTITLVDVDLNNPELVGCKGNLSKFILCELKSDKGKPTLKISTKANTILIGEYIDGIHYSIDDPSWLDIIIAGIKQVPEWEDYLRNFNRLAKIVKTFQTLKVNDVVNDFSGEEFIEPSRESLGNLELGFLNFPGDFFNKDLIEAWKVFDTPATRALMKNLKIEDKVVWFKEFNEARRSIPKCLLTTCNKFEYKFSSDEKLPFPLILDINKLKKDLETLDCTPIVKCSGASWKRDIGVKIFNTFKSLCDKISLIKDGRSHYINFSSSVGIEDSGDFLKVGYNDKNKVLIEKTINADREVLAVVQDSGIDYVKLRFFYSELKDGKRKFLGYVHNKCPEELILHKNHVAAGFYKDPMVDTWIKNIGGITRKCEKEEIDFTKKIITGSTLTVEDYIKINTSKSVDELASYLKSNRKNEVLNSLKNDVWYTTATKPKKSDDDYEKFTPEFRAYLRFCDYFKYIKNLDFSNSTDSVARVDFNDGSLRLFCVRHDLGESIMLSPSIKTIIIQLKTTLDNGDCLRESSLDFMGVPHRYDPPLISYSSAVNLANRFPGLKIELELEKIKKEEKEEKEEKEIE